MQNQEQQLHAAKTRIRELEAENEKLKEVLRPLADMVGAWKEYRRKGLSDAHIFIAAHAGNKGFGKLMEEVAEALEKISSAARIAGNLPCIK